MPDVERVAEPQHRAADAALRQAFVGRQHDDDHQGGFLDIFKAKLGGLAAQEVGAKARFLHIAFDHCLTDGSRIHRQAVAAEDGFFVDGGHELRLGQQPLACNWPYEVCLQAGS